MAKPTMTEAEKAVEVVRTNRVDKDPTDIVVRAKQSAFGGTVYFVRWKNNREQGREMETLSFFPAGSEEGTFLWAGEEAIKYFSRLTPPTTLEKVARGFGLNGVAAIIALLITVTICYLVVGAKAEVPGILANALTTILGFFFGREAGKAAH